MPETSNYQKPNLYLEDVVMEIVKRIQEIEMKIKFLQNRWTPLGINTATLEQFAKGKIYLEVKIEDGELKFRDKNGQYIVVGSGKLRKLAEEINERLLKHGLVVVVTPEGVNKSMVATAVIWDLPWHDVGISLIIRAYRIDEENYSGFMRFLMKYNEEVGKYVNGKLLILHDPDMKIDTLDEIETTISNLINITNSTSSEIPKPLVLIVIPESIYNMLNKKIRDMIEKYRFNVPQGLSLNDANEEEEEEE